MPLIDARKFALRLRAGVWEFPFDGVTYDDLMDGYRLKTQLERVWRELLTGDRIYTKDLEKRCGPGSAASLSSRCRDFRKPAFGCYDVKCIPITRTKWQYYLELDEQGAPIHLPAKRELFIARYEQEGNLGLMNREDLLLYAQKLQRRLHKKKPFARDDLVAYAQKYQRACNIDPFKKYGR